MCSAPVPLPLDGRPQPGFAAERLVALMRAAIARIGLDLGGITVLTEAASGAYATTASLAGLAGAERVFAVARDNRHGSRSHHARQTRALAAAAGVEARLEIVTSPGAVAADSQIVTNSGNLRPLDRELIVRLPSQAVIALMYEVWELRAADLDLAACRARGLPVVAVNERHPAIDVFRYLGPLALRQLHDAGFAVLGCRLALLCDNPFAPSIRAALEAAGAEVQVAERCEELPAGPVDAVLVALRPRAAPVIGAAEARHLLARVGRAPLVQFWGDLDRAALAMLGLQVWPEAAPPAGHMGMLLPAIGPEALVRLQAGGLRAAELVYRHGAAAAVPGSEAELLSPSAEAVGLAG